MDINITDSELTEYQLDAVDAYLKFNEKAGGGGSIIMPPNSGKILVGFNS